MNREVYVIDDNGYIQDIFVKKFNEQGECEEEIANNVVVEKPNNGLYRARWTGVEWIEDMAQEEIDELNNQPILPTQEDRIDMLENIILMMMI